MQLQVTWYHIAVAFDGEHHSLYVDGKLAQRFPGPFNVAAAPLTVLQPHGSFQCGSRCPSDSEA